MNDKNFLMILLDEFEKNNSKEILEILKFIDREVAKLNGSNNE